jgi:riboflavin synthase
MFTGIIESRGKLIEIIATGLNRSFWIESSLSADLKPDQSLAHDGVCLTVEEVKGALYQVTAIAETLERTNLSHWQPGKIINLERCMQLNGRLDGHIVQGHVDTTAKCVSILSQKGSWLFTFEFNPQFAHLVIEKGSITVNGTSLTCFNITLNSFDVAIIPYTYLNTNINALEVGSSVNVEFDILGKYVQRSLQV